jgi:hypothetical protein
MARIGIDFGGVVVTAGGAGTRGDTSLAGAELEEVVQPGVFEAVRELVERCAGRVWIVSKARPHMQARSRGWLEAVDFHGRTGLPREHVRFCLEREDKAALCRELAVTHFVDDRVALMQILRGVVPHLYLFGDPRDARGCPPWATFVTAWAELMRALEPDLPRVGGERG